MSLSKLTENLNVHQSLPDDPALTTAQLKAKWDEAVNTIKSYINETETEEIDLLVTGLQNTDASLQGQINITNTTVQENALTLSQQQLNLIYPIGSIYMNVNSTNPGTLFGGTWQRIQDRFLLASGSTYANGTTGGNATHIHTNPNTGAYSGNTGNYSGTSGTWSGNTGSTTLTANQIPSHTHSYTKADFNAQGRGWKLGDGGTVQVYTTGVGASTTGATGGGQGHTHSIPSHTHSIPSHSHTIPSHTHSVGNTGSSSNIPPYLAVYVWKRTA